MGQVQLDKVWKLYGDFEAVKGISLEIHDGEFVSLLGPSGCGKTSTLRMIAGLEEISRGEAFIDGIRINDLDPGNRHVAMAFESYALYPHLSVFENVAYPLRIRKIPDTEIKERVAEICASLGITGYLNDYPSALSGGAQQRTGLARALIRPAALYLLDEVLSHLDATERTMLRAEVRRIQKLMNLTALFVTHDQLEALAVSDRIIVMNDGEIQQIGTPEEIYDTPSNLFVAGFVGEPPMNIVKTRRHTDNGAVFLDLAGKRASVKDMGLPWVPELEEFFMAIRPKNLSRTSVGDPRGLSGKVHTFEMLGDHTLSSVELGEGVLMFMIESYEERMELDQEITVVLDPDWVLFYDPTSGALLHRP
jgi:multiple sugar transport system ATP-binding protein